MDTNALINLIETVSKTLNAQGFEHIELTHEGTSLLLNKQSVSSSGPAQVVSVPQASTQPSQSNNVTESMTESTVHSQEPAVEVVGENYKTIDSPIVGTFYDAPSPEADVYVKVGDQVKKGDVVCIVEAMKLMNEIEAEIDGEIVEILVSNEGPVEYGQPLFKVK